LTGSLELKRSQPVSLVAHANAQLGVGEAARRLNLLLVAAGLKTRVIPIKATKSKQIDEFAALNPERLGEFTISCVNPDQVGYILCKYPELLSEKNKHVGFWAWELPTTPPWFQATGSLLNEVWTVSEFAATSLRGSANNVRKITLPMPSRDISRTGNWESLGLPNCDFTVLVSFDFFSDFSRKNPMAAVEAYLLAFREVDGARLVIKSINGDRFPEDMSSLVELAGGRRDIIFIDDYLERYENEQLLLLADVFLSLHRSEGYGINLADAMACGTPVISTGYSGNLEFQTESNSILLPYSLVPVSNYGGFKVSSCWAEADINEAARALRELRNNRSKLTRLATAAKSDVKIKFSLKKTTQIFLEENELT